MNTEQITLAEIAAAQKLLAVIDDPDATLEQVDAAAELIANWFSNNATALLAAAEENAQTKEKLTNYAGRCADNMEGADHDEFIRWEAQFRAAMEIAKMLGMDKEVIANLGMGGAESKSRGSVQEF